MSPVVPGVFQAAGSKPARQEGTCGAESHLEAGVARRAAERETVGADHPGLPGRRHEDSGSEKEESMEESRSPEIQTGLGFYRLSQAARQKTQEAKGRRGSAHITEDSEYSVMMSLHGGMGWMSSGGTLDDG